MLTYEHDDSDSDAVRAAKLALYEVQRDAADSAREWQVRLADAQQNLAAARRAEEQTG